VGTDPEGHVKVLADLFKSGATGVHIHSGQRDQKRVIDFMEKKSYLVCDRFRGKPLDELYA
jgi:hypothetical protein